PTTIDSADGYVGGNLVSAWNADGSLSTPSASGVYGNTTSTDLGLTNSALIATQGGALVGGVGDLSGVTNQFTATLWFKLGANYQFTKNGRFFEIDSRVANNGTTVGNQAASADGN